jgi:polysaccharide biosynthesis protein PslG
MRRTEESSPAMTTVNRGPGAAPHGPPRGHRWFRTTRAKAGAAAAAILAAAGMVTLVLSSGPAGAAVNTFGVADPALASESASNQAADLASMKAVGINAVRLDVNWNYIQSSGPNSYSWGWLDQVVASARAAGMSVDLIAEGCPQWAAVSGAQAPNAQPASPAAFAQFAGALAARYAPKGVQTFEIGNEPNNAVFWQPAPNPAAYTADLIAAYKAIKKVAPSAVVLSGGLAPETNDGTNIAPITFLQAMYADGAQGYFDGVGYHPYSYPALPNTYAAWSGWSQMSQTSPSIRSVMTANGDGGKQIYVPDAGAPTGGPNGVSQATQATEMTQAIAAAKSTSWIGAMYFYTWQDRSTDTSTSENFFGLLTYAGVQKPAYAAVKNAIG